MSLTTNTTVINGWVRQLLETPLDDLVEARNRVVLRMSRIEQGDGPESFKESSKQRFNSLLKGLDFFIQMQKRRNQVMNNCGSCKEYLKESGICSYPMNFYFDDAENMRYYKPQEGANTSACGFYSSDKEPSDER